LLIGLSSPTEATNDRAVSMFWQKLKKKHLYCTQGKFKVFAIIRLARSGRRYWE
jgi:hypothetical protein